MSIGDHFIGMISVICYIDEFFWHQAGIEVIPTVKIEVFPDVKTRVVDKVSKFRMYFHLRSYNCLKEN